MFEVGKGNRLEVPIIKERGKKRYYVCITAEASAASNRQYLWKKQANFQVDMFIPFATLQVHSRVLQYGPFTLFCNLMSIHVRLLESDLLDVSAKRNKDTFGFPVSHLLSKCGISSSFYLAQGFL